MPRPMPDTRFATPDPRLARTLWQWLAIGLLLVALFPAARGYSAAIGWLPFWLLAAPTSALCVLHRRHFSDWLAAARSRILVPGPRRRRHRRPGQARRIGFGEARRSHLHAA